jgi:hypothetical protein
VEDWEGYHLPLLRMHQAHLHDWGIASGLEVSVTAGGGEVEVQPGVAVDGRGELIALSGSGQADISLVEPGEADRQISAPFRLSIAGLAGQVRYLTIEYAQRLRLTEGVGGQLEQTPWLRLQAVEGENAYVDDGSAIILAVVEIDAGGAVIIKANAVELPHSRRILASTAEALHLRRSTVTGGKVGEQMSARLTAWDGGLRVTVPAADDNIIFQRQDDGHFAKLVFRSEQSEINGHLQVQGNLEVNGRGLFVSEMQLTNTGADGKTYGIFSGADGHWHFADQDSHLDRLLISRDGNVGVGTTDPGVYKLSVEGGDVHFAGTLTVGLLHLAQEGFAAIHYGKRGKLGDALNFNPDLDQNGLWIEGSSDGSESGGLFMNGNTLCIWSPGDNDLLRVYDEDDLSTPQPLPKFVISGIGDVGIGTMLPQGKLDVQGDIRAGDSSLYFTKVDHNHTGIGNMAGWAAIENAADYGALMILGRAGTGRGRYVRLWDYLQVNGSLDITGNLGVGTAAPTHRFHVLAPDAVGLFESTGRQAFLRLSTNEGINNRVEITNRPGGVLTLWTAGGGDIFRIERDGRIHIGGNRTGAFVQFNDDLWFSDPQNGTIEILNGPASTWGTMIGFFRPPSSIEFKKEVVQLHDLDWNELLEDTLKTNLVNFRYKADSGTSRPRLGVIVEQCPTYLVGEDGKSLSTVEYIAMLHGAIKSLAQQLQTYQALTMDRLDALTAKVAGTGTARP